MRVQVWQPAGPLHPRASSLRRAQHWDLPPGAGTLLPEQLPAQRQGEEAEPASKPPAGPWAWSSSPCTRQRAGGRETYLARKCQGAGFLPGMCLWLLKRNWACVCRHLIHDTLRQKKANMRVTSAMEKKAHTCHSVTLGDPDFQFK